MTHTNKFQILKNKHLLRILLLIVVIGAGAYFLFSNIRKVSAEWFDQNWFYRQAVTITVTSSASDVTNLDTWFTMNTSALISANKLQSSCQDLRFTNANGKLLPYYIDSGCNTTATKIWVKIDLVPKNSTTYTVYAYYGNPNAIAASDSNKFNLYNGLVGYWNMNEASWTNDCSTATVKDLSVGGHNGTACPASTGPTGGASGKYGNGGSFDGSNDYVGLGTWDLTGGTRTISFWFNSTSNPSGLSDIRPFSGNYYDIQFNGRSAGNLSVSIYDSTFRDLLYPSSNFAAGTWYQITVTSDTNSLKLYVNGDLKTTNTTYTITSHSYNLNVGANYSGSAHWFNGGLDDIRIYNRVLSAGEVSQLYSDGTSSILTAVQGQSAPSVSFATEEKGPAPVAAWRFDEGQGLTVYDDSSNNNDGTLSGTTKPVWITSDQCVSGKCLYFNGSTAYITVADSNNLDFGTGDFTVGTWIKTSTTANSRIIYKYNSDTTRGFMLSANTTYANKVSFSLFGTGGVDQGIAASNTSINDGKWHYVVGVRSGTTDYIYIDGNSENSATGASADVTGASNLYVGSNSAPTNFLNGFLDDVKIYPYARTAAQIKADYASRKSTSGVSAKVGNEFSWMTNGLVGYWKMDETSGTLADSSGNSNTGTWYGTGVSHYSAGKFGNGGGFNGTDDYVDAGNPASLNFGSGNFTLSVWVKGGGIDRETYIQKNTDTWVPGYWLWHDMAATGLSFNVYGSTNGVGVDCTYVKNMTDGWHHVVGVRNGEKCYLYLDGVQVATDTQAGLGSTDGAGNLRLGIDNSNVGKLAGNLDEVRVYNRALSPKEVADLYNWAPGPVGYWKMDDKVSGDSQTLVDSSTYGNNGTTHYGVNTTGMNCKIIGKYGSGCLFDGTDDNVSVANTPSLNPTAAITLEAWVKFNAKDVMQVIIGKGDFTATGVGYTLRGRNTNIFSAFFYDSSGNMQVLDFGSFTTNVWYHVAVSYNGTTASSYINGTFVNSLNFSGLKPSTYNLYLGRWAVSDAYQFNGSIDDVRIYDYARTQKQIMEDMNAGHPAVGSPIGSYAAYWKFDEGHDNTVYDSSVNANTGTNHGASWTNDGKFGKALSFDGVSSYVDMGTGANLWNNTQGTISLWFKYSNNASGWGQPVLTFGNQSTGLQIRPYGNYVLLRNSNEASPYRWNSALKSGGIPENQWVHLVITQDGVAPKIYVNGSLTYTVNSGGDLTAWTSGLGSVNLYLGHIGGTDTYFKGVIDEVKIYPFALTADEIKTEYNQGKALVMGSFSDTSSLTGGSVASNSASAAYCIPGDTSTCNSPLGEWKFDEKVSGDAQTVYDTSGNGNNGTTHYGANLTGMNCKVPGKYGTACQFDGVDDYVNLANTIDLSNGGSFEAWVKISDAVTQQIVWSDGISGGGWITARVYSSEIRLSYYNGTSYVNAGKAVSIGWHNIAATWQTGGIGQAVYIDGNSTSQTSGDSFYSYTDSHRIGIRKDNTSPFNGLIDNVQIFNYARTPAQVAWDYNRGKPVGWWKFDECQGTTAYDSSGNGYSGTINISGGTQTTLGTCTSPVDGTGAWYNGKTGKFNSGMNFDSSLNDYVSIPTISSLATGTPFTLSAWVKPTYTGNYETIMGYNGTHRLLISSVGQMLSQQDGNFFSAGAGDVPNTTWTYVTYWNNGTTERWYINGTQSGSDHSTSNAEWDSAFKIGQYDLANYPYQGLIDEVKIYNYALTSQQIKMDYNQGSSVRFAPITGKP